MYKHGVTSGIKGSFSRINAKLKSCRHTAKYCIALHQSIGGGRG